MRDEFAKNTKDVLAKRVGYLCSNPGCRAPTSGPSSDPTKAISIGEAAHISAAAPGGKRYDVSLSSVQRRSHENGLWLCSNCATLIDTDGESFTVEDLRSWKRRAESLALELVKAGSFARFSERDRLVAELFWAIPQRFMVMVRFVLFEFRQLGEVPQHIERVFCVNHGLAGSPRFHELTVKIAEEALALHSLNRWSRVMVKDEKKTPFHLADLILLEVETIRSECRELLDRYGAVINPGYALKIELLKNRAENLLFLKKCPAYPEIEDVHGLAELLVMCRDLFDYNTAIKASDPLGAELIGRG